MSPAPMPEMVSVPSAPEVVQAMLAPTQSRFHTNAWLVPSSRKSMAAQDNAGNTQTARRLTLIRHFNDTIGGALPDRTEFLDLVAVVEDDGGAGGNGEMTHGS